jgi:hypothetical protein
MNILEAMDDPALFGPHFRGGSWTAWRAFLAALFGLAMTDDQLAAYRHHTGRAEPPAEPFKEAALVCGRRGGKSRVLALIATYLAAFRDYTPFLAPGEVATVAIIAADRRQARSIFRFTIGLLSTVDLLADLIEDDGAETITLKNRVVIEIHTASFRVTRGYTFAAVLADETAFWRTDDSAVPDIEIFRSLRPGMASIPGAMLLNASSPYAKRGVLWSTFRTYYGREGARVLVWRGTTAEMNPTIDPAIIAEAYEADPESAAAEYGAEFRSDVAAFVAREVVDAVTVAQRFELSPLPGVSYVGFVDPSGGSADAMTLAIAHSRAAAKGESAAAARDGVAVLDAVREVRPPFSPESVVTEFAILLRSYQVRTVTGDRYAGEWPRERFREHGISYEVAESPRSDLYRDLLPVLNSGACELLDVPRLATQLCALERRTTRAGRDSIDHPPGGHDDVANAVAGALLLAAKPKPKPARAIRLDFMSR